MSRSERLFSLLQALRRYRRPVSGKALAQELGVSMRTLYRDIATLQAQGADIEGEPGVGYVLRPGFILPPLMFSEDEIEALVLGSRAPEQWGSPATPVDFYDLKGDLTALLALGGMGEEFGFEPGSLDCLHPGRSARIVRGGAEIGHIGELHPGVMRALDLTYAPILFEIDFGAAFVAKLAQFRETSRYPLIRRDISFTVPESVAFRRIGERVSVAAASLLQELRVFDVYHGQGVEFGRKSVALGLILQDLSRTLTDEEADRVVEAVRSDLRSNLDARIRE